jgi:hypothetical protein
MSSVQLYVGLDYHQDSVNVCVLDEHAKVRLNRPVANDWRKIREAVAPLGGAVAPRGGRGLLRFGGPGPGAG